MAYVEDAPNFSFSLVGADGSDDIIGSGISFGTNDAGIYFGRR